MPDDGRSVLHRVDHRWFSLLWLIVGGFAGLSPLILALTQGFREWVRPFAVWAATCFGPCFVVALFYIGRTNALMADAGRRALIHVLGVYGWVRVREVPYESVAEIRHITLVEQRRRTEWLSYRAEIAHGGGVIRFADDAAGTLAGEVARAVGGVVRRSRMPSPRMQAVAPLLVVMAVGVVAFALTGLILRLL